MIVSEVTALRDGLIGGSKFDTDDAWLAEILTPARAKVKKITTIGDDPDVISKGIGRVVEEETYLLITARV